jgi:hypothetical protein
MKPAVSEEYGKRAEFPENRDDNECGDPTAEDGEKTFGEDCLTALWHDSPLPFSL